MLPHSWQRERVSEQVWFNYGDSKISRGKRWEKQGQCPRQSEMNLHTFLEASSVDPHLCTLHLTGQIWIPWTRHRACERALHFLFKCQMETWVWASPLRTWCQAHLSESCLFPIIVTSGCQVATEVCLHVQLIALTIVYVWMDFWPKLFSV
jgi:hypothetical protein